MFARVSAGMAVACNSLLAAVSYCSSVSSQFERIMKSLCQFALLFFFSGSISQALAQQYRPEDTAYYDANYNAVPDSSGAVYFRLPAVPENERWRVQYFFLPGGEPAFTGVYQAVKEDGGWSIEPVVAIKDGPFTFYTKGGKVASEGTYTRDLETGLWRYYRRGRLRESRLYLDDKRIDSVFHGKVSSLSLQSPCSVVNLLFAMVFAGQ